MLNSFLLSNPPPCLSPYQIILIYEPNLHEVSLILLGLPSHSDLDLDGTMPNVELV